MKNKLNIKALSLFDICNPKQWKTVSTKDLSESGYPCYSANGKIGFYRKYNHEFPTLLIGCRGTCGSLHITEPFSYTSGNAMALDNLNEELALIRYLFYFLKNRGFSDIISGSSQPQITRQGLQKIKVFLPPLEDQKRIVKILDAADALRQKRKQAITLLDDYLKSIFLDMFGDPVINTKKIKTYRGSDLFKFSSGKFNPTKNLSDDFKYLTYGGNGITGYSKDYLIDYDTLVIGRVGAYCGCVHKTNGKIWITDNAIFVKDFKQEVNLEFMNFQFKFLQFNKFADFSGQPKITQKPLEKTEYLQPPLGDQNKFAEIVKKTESIKQKMLIQSQELEVGFQALMQKAFRGEL